MVKIILIISIITTIVFNPVLSTYCTNEVIPQRTGTSYYISNSGDDSNPGTSPTQPWKTLSKVNSSKFLPGDVIHFERGGTWRGQLKPQSGNEQGYITYTSYGQGSKPSLLGSIGKNKTTDWVKVSENIWALNTEDILPGSSTNIDSSRIRTWQEDGAVVKAGSISLPSGNYYNVQCVSTGNSSNDIQLMISGINIESGKSYKLSFRAKCSLPFRLPAIRIMERRSPWKNYISVHDGLSPVITSDWKEYDIDIKALYSDTDARLTFFLGGVLPQKATFNIDSIRLTELKTVNSSIDYDVGNIIFNNGKECGVKVFNEADLKEQNNFWYDKERRTIKIYSDENPAEKYDDIECALTKDIINQGNRAYVIYDGLDIKYGGAHGIGGYDTHHIIVRNCDVSYIGGGEINHKVKRMRYGNGIEFWANAHNNLVENCRIWEIYDSGITNQNSGNPAEQYNITYRNNTIWNCEWSFEYWHNPKTSKTFNIYFENNNCYDAGFGWGHNQRPDGRGGAHLFLSTNTADTSGVYIRGNTFENAKFTSLLLASTWNGLDTLFIESNSFTQPEAGTYAHWKGTRYKLNNILQFDDSVKKDISSQIDPS